MNLKAIKLIKFIDLTSLLETLSENELIKLCQRCQSEYYKVAALCVEKKYVKFCKDQLEPSQVKVASVFNFPYGNQDISEVIESISDSLSDGVDELDIVIPLERLKKTTSVNDFKEITLEFVTEIRAHVPNKVIKFIISTDVLLEPLLIIAATEAVILGKGDFVKTCTGKTGAGVTKEALVSILEVISGSNAKIGIKVSGGVKTFQFASEIYTLVQGFYKSLELTENDLRFGSSTLLDDLLSQK